MGKTITFFVVFGTTLKPCATGKKSRKTDLLIPILPQAIQTQIAALIQESFALKAESEKLLAKAKQVVEIAIEEGEDKAMAWVK